MIRHGFPFRSMYHNDMLRRFLERAGRGHREDARVGARPTAGPPDRAVAARARPVPGHRRQRRGHRRAHLGETFKRIFFREEDHVELYSSIMKGVGERHRTPFFNALREYAKQPTGVFHALPLARGKSIMNSNWIGDLAQFYGMNLFMAETSATSGGLDSLLDPVGPLKTAQEFAARAFGARRTYFATNGTSHCEQDRGAGAGAARRHRAGRPQLPQVASLRAGAGRRAGGLPRLVSARPVLDVRRRADPPHQADAARLSQGRHAEPRAAGAADQLHLRWHRLRRRAGDDGVPGDQARPGVPVGRGLVRVRLLPPDLPPAHRHGERQRRLRETLQDPAYAKRYAEFSASFGAEAWDDDERVLDTRLLDPTRRGPGCVSTPPTARTRR